MGLQFFSDLWTGPKAESSIPGVHILSNLKEAIRSVFSNEWSCQVACSGTKLKQKFIFQCCQL